MSVPTVPGQFPRVPGTLNGCCSRRVPAPLGAELSEPIRSRGARGSAVVGTLGMVLAVVTTDDARQTRCAFSGGGFCDGV